MNLKNNHEIVGNLYAVIEGDTSCRLKFSCEQEITIPSKAIQIEELRSLVGTRIGIFNCDGKFFVRTIKKR